MQKKGSKLWVIPVCLAVPAIVVPVAIILSNKQPVNPEHEHVLGGYYLDVENNKLYGVCKVCGEKFELSEQQFAQFENKILVFKGNGYVLTNDSLKKIVHDAFNSSVDVYLIKGTYEIDENWYVEEHNVTVNIHGLLDYSNKPMATFRCVENSLPEHKDKFIYQWHGMNLNVDHIKLLGLEQNTPSGRGNWQVYGIQPTTFTAKQCELIGCHTTHAIGKVTYDECSFDSTGFKDRDGTPIAEYCIYMWNGNTDLLNCKFKTDGKAVKIYTDFSTEPTQKNKYFVINNCAFNKVSELANKAAVEIDSRNVIEPYCYYIDLQQSQLNGFDNLYNAQGERYEFDPDPPTSY